MAPSFDCAAVSSLLCAEDDSVFDENENYEATMSYRSYRNHAQNQSFNGGHVLPLLQSEETLNLVIAKECQHLPNIDYLNKLRNGDLDLVGRTEAVDWICKVHSRFGFGPLCAYLSINYLDRFLSSYELPKGKAWTMQLLAVACLSLGAKMEETEVPLSLDLQAGESKFVFQAKTIQRMELLVLSTLKWRMQAVTPFSFLDSFHSKITGDVPLPDVTILRSIQLISNSLKGIDLLEFKPSEHAAAAVVISSAEEIPTILDSEKAVDALSPYVEKERLLKCMDLIRDLAMKWGFENRVGIGSSRLPSAPHSPNGVLEAACLSFKTDDSTINSSSNTNSPVTKRRRLNSACEFEAIIRK